MNTLTQNINTILETKYKLGNIIKSFDKPVPDKFEDYPAVIQEIINELQGE